MTPADPHSAVHTAPTERDAPLCNPIFAVNERAYTWREVLSAWEFLGMLEPHVERLTEGEALRLAPPPVDDEALQEALTELRYELNLITAEETEAWLAERDLSLDDLQEYLLRHVQLETLASTAPSHARTCRFDAECLAQTLWRDLHLANSWPELLPPVMRRCLVQQLNLNEQSFDEQWLEAARESLLRRHQLDPAELRKWLDRSYFLRETFQRELEREALYRQYCQQIAAADACRRHLSAMRPQLYRVEYEAASFHDYDIAREAYLCVTMDADTLAEVTVRAGGSHVEGEAFIEDLPVDVGQYLLSAQPGELMRPIALADEGTFVLLLLRHKHEPAMNDEAVAERVRASIIEKSFEYYLQRDIRWPRWQLINKH